MKTIHLHFRKTDRWLWLLFLAGISFALSLSNTLRAQTCPAGWTSVAGGAIYPDTVTGTLTNTTSGINISNVIFGGTDGLAIRFSGNNFVVVKFNQTLSANGSLKVVMARSSAFIGTLLASFSSDGITYSSTQTLAAASTTYQTFTLTPPADFQYVKFENLTTSTSSVYLDDVHYEGSFCQAPVSSYSACGSGESQVWQPIRGETVAGLNGPTAANAADRILNGPDNLSSWLLDPTEELIMKFSKSLAAGDTIRITGVRYSGAANGAFTVLTSRDGFTFTTLQALSFSSTPQTLKAVATSAFQYVKLVPSGTGQINVDVMDVFGKTCVQPSGACLPKYTSIAPASVTGVGFPGTAPATTMLVKDGVATTILLASTTGTFNMAQTINGGSDVLITASASVLSNFEIEISADGTTFTSIGIITPTLNMYRDYVLRASQSFRYIKITTPSTAGSLIDYVGVATVLCTPCTATGVATTVQATCGAGGAVNANAALTLSSYSSGITKIGYSAGSSYAGPDFSTATAVTAAPMTLVNNLTNPSVLQPYTIRVFQDAACYKDVVVTLAPTQCLTSDLSLSLSPVTQTGAKGELLTYTLTLTNAGPDAETDVQVDVKVPTNATLLTASPQVGTYSAATQKWVISSLPVGAKTLTVTLKMN